MSEITRDDIISKDALEAPLILADNLDKAVKKFKEFRDSAVKTNEATQNTKSTKEATDAVEKLTAEQAELIKVNNQLVAVQAKNNEAYAEAKRKVDDANAALKNRISLGERDAKTITRQNASLKELQAALLKNRQEYAKLTNEQDRSEKQGQNLLKIIQRQDADVKSLSAAMGQHQANVGNYRSAWVGLGNTFQTVAPGLSGMAQGIWSITKASLAFIATPIGAVIATIGLALTPLISFFKDTAIGADIASRQVEGFQYVLTRFRDKINELGQAELEAETPVKKLVDAHGKFVKFLAAPFLLPIQGAIKKYGELSQAGKDYADTMDRINDEQVSFSVTEAEMENQIKRLILQSKNRTTSEKERIALIDQALKLEGDLQIKRKTFAEDELSALLQVNQARLNSVGLIQQEGETQYTYAKRLVDAIRETTLSGGDELADSFAESLKKINEAEAQSISVLEKLQSRRDEIQANAEKVAEQRRMKEEADRKKEEEARKKALDDEFKLKEFYAQQELDNAPAEKKIEKELALLELRFQRALELTKMGTDEEQLLIEQQQQAINDIYKKYAKKKEEITQSTAKTEEQIRTESIDNQIEDLKKLMAIYDTWGNQTLALFSALSDRRIADIDAEIEKLDEKTQDEVRKAGDNDAAIAAIEANAEARREQLELKKKQEQRKAAVAQKASALFEAALLNGINILNAARSAPPPFNIPAIIQATALGVLQIATIAAKPIPQFEKGTQFSPEGLAIVGEKGPELKIEPSGKTSLTPGVPTLDYLKAGTKIIPYKETMRMIALSGLGEEALKAREQSQQIDLARSLNQIEKNTRKLGKQSPTTNLFKQGSLTYEQIQRENGNRKNIRRTNLGY